MEDVLWVSGTDIKRLQRKKILKKDNMQGEQRGEAI